MDTPLASIPQVATYTIPACHRARLVSKLEQLARRADKLGTTRPTWRILPGTTVEQFLRPDARHAEDTFSVRCIQVEVSAAPVCLAGWHFCGILERRGEQNRLFAIEPLPDWCRTVESRCDHCQTDRRRNETYIVRHGETGAYKQVGSSCLADFVGRASAETVTLSCMVLRDLHEMLDRDSDEYEFGMGGVSPYDLDHDLGELLCFALESIKRAGYVSGKAAMHPGATTGSTAMSMLVEGKLRSENWGMSRDQVLAAHRERAGAIAAYWAAAPCTSDYDHNCKLVAQQGYATRRDANLVASMAYIYDRRMAEAARLSACKNEHLGTIKERLTLEVTVDAINFLELYGSYMHVMRDPQGRDLRWFASGPAGLEPGKSYKITGTVKKHNEREGRKITVLTRCAIAKDKPARARKPRKAPAAADSSEIGMAA